MDTTKKLITILMLIVVWMSANAQDTYIDETYPPQFPGGDAALISFLNANIEYPVKAAQDSVEGKVIVQFRVKKNGKIDHVKVLQSVRKDIDEEAVRVVKLIPHFDPGKQNGETVDMFYTVPVTFKLFDEMAPMLPSEDTAGDIPDDFLPPMFPGGEQALMLFIKTNLKYPPQAAKRNAQGKVVVHFIVDKTGKVTNIKIAKSVDIYLDTEAIRVCKLLPDFYPARQNGEPISVWFSLPISFMLE